MTKLSKKRGSKMIHSMKKKAIGALLLALLLPGQLVFAQAAPVEATTTVKATATPILAQTEEVAAPVTEPTVQEVLLDVCKTNGYGLDCAKTLLGMLWTESSNRSTVIGDGGRARGYFQIHYKLHKIPVTCAEDLVCSANWTINYLESNSYPKYVNYAVQCHNSCNVNNGYAAKVSRNAKLLWNQPLDIIQAAPIELAMK